MVSVSVYAKASSRRKLLIWLYNEVTAEARGDNWGIVTVKAEPVKAVVALNQIHMSYEG